MNRPGEPAVHATWVSCWPLSSKPWLVYRTRVRTTDRPKKKLARMLAGLGLATIETVSNCMPERLSDNCSRELPDMQARKETYGERKFSPCTTPCIPLIGNYERQPVSRGRVIVVKTAACHMACCASAKRARVPISSICTLRTSIMILRTHRRNSGLCAPPAI